MQIVREKIAELDKKIAELDKTSGFKRHLVLEEMEATLRRRNILVELFSEDLQRGAVRRSIGQTVSPFITLEPLMFKVILEDNDSQERLENVSGGQFFLDNEGYLCQREEDEEDCYFKIAFPDGTPCGEYESCMCTDTPVKKIYPRIKRFEL